ncbi:hypothetical protein QBC39DRAFT_123945 [Podospora conica]|nr:hypothetical protein QBC39DRAFT_123945 [Schizothecium conicum]
MFPCDIQTRPRVAVAGPPCRVPPEPPLVRNWDLNVLVAQLGVGRVLTSGSASVVLEKRLGMDVWKTWQTAKHERDAVAEAGDDWTKRVFLPVVAHPQHQSKLAGLTDTRNILWHDAVQKGLQRRSCGRMGRHGDPSSCPPDVSADDLGPRPYGPKRNPETMLSLHHLAYRMIRHHEGTRRCQTTIPRTAGPRSSTQVGDM